MPKLTVLPQAVTVHAESGANLLEVLRRQGILLDAPCGGRGICGKCRVFVDGREATACKTLVDGDMTVRLPEGEDLAVLYDGIGTACNVNPIREGYLLAFDIGTTSVVCFLLDGKRGAQIACSSMRNPQCAFGADVVSRIRSAMEGTLQIQCDLIRKSMTELAEEVCASAGIAPDRIGVVSVVGNPAMQQLFLGISPENLARIPFAPVLTRGEIVPCGPVLPICPDAQLLIVPDISGYVGADTLGCVLATGLYQSEAYVLMMDIGTNGEIVLGNRDRMIACATATGPALEGANIRFGMRGTDGAIDHVWLEEGKIRSSVIGGGTARGICGSGLIDAVAVLLEMGLVNSRGRIQSATEIDGQRVVYLTDTIYLTQEDIRQVQLAKGAICAGIRLMARQLGIEMDDIRRLELAGAFGNYLNPASGCRIGLLPPELEGRITAVGNAAGSGAKLLACDREALDLAQALSERIEFLELASLPQFAKTYAKAMSF